MEQHPIVIIGAGLTGLTCAHQLVRRGIEPLVLERSGRVGGSIRSYKMDGFLYESGPNTGVISNVETVQLFDQLANDCKLEIANEHAKKRYVVKAGKPCALPSSPISGIATPLFSVSDKFRLLGEPFRAAGSNPDESLADMVRRRMGESFLNYAVDPFVGGIYAGDPELLITKYALPKLYALEQDYGSFIKGGMKKAKERKNLSELEKRVSKAVFSIKGGLEELPKALLKSIGEENVRTNCRGLQIKPNAEGYEISGEGMESIQTPHIISCVGAHELADLLPFVPINVMNKITNMHYAKMTSVSIGFKKWKAQPLDGFGVLIPSIEKRNILGVLYLSSCFSNRAPEGGAMLTAYAGGVKHPELINLSDEEVFLLVEKEMQQLFKIDTFAPEIFEIHRYQHAIPQYDITTSDRLKAIAQIESTYSGLTIGGNLHNGIGMADRIKQGTRLANELELNNY